MEIRSTTLPEVKELSPVRIGDSRGFFSEVWNQRTFASVGIDVSFAQDNHIRSPRRGTLRGLHYQLPPAAQGKLIRVTRGAIFDVAVDIRRGSPTFGQHAAVVLSADNWHQLWIPAVLHMDIARSKTTQKCNTRLLIFIAPRMSVGLPGMIRA